MFPEDQLEPVNIMTSAPQVVVPLTLKAAPAVGGLGVIVGEQPALAGFMFARDIMKIRATSTVNNASL